MSKSKTLISLISITVIALLACGIFFTMGGIINSGSGIPPGLYWKVDKPLAIGKAVVFCPTNKPVFQDAKKRGMINEGSCPDGYGSLMLKVAGKRKDIVTINETGVYINDILLPGSQPLLKDRSGQIMPTNTVNHYELKENEVVLMSEPTENPFDSRYFGPIEADQIDSVISPIFQ